MIRPVHLRGPILLLLLASLLLAGCGLPANSDDGEAITFATQTAQSLASKEEAAVPTATTLPPTDTPAPAATIEHQVTPESPAGTSGVLTDLSSSALADEGRALADSFVTNLLERPFTAGDMEYQPHLDITGAEISKNGPFLYVSIRLEEAHPTNEETMYGVELDLDVDGRGDWLILANAPSDDGWTVNGVRACHDEDDDVGAATPMRSDPPDQDRTGYEVCVFDSGQGISPDEAWVRLAPSDSSVVEIAFLHSLIDNDPQFLWGVWADSDEMNQAAFDYHDQLTLEEAGSADSSNDAYPLAELALVDNTCRWSYGFSPTGSEPGICTPPATPTPEPQEDTCVKGQSPGSGYWWDEERCQWRIIN